MRSDNITKGAITMANKRVKRANLYIGQLVVCTDHPEAQVRTVSELIDHFMVQVQWYEGSHQCVQPVDCSMLYEPTLRQIEYSIAHNGKLVAMNDIMQLA
jgi:hypothetical protein